LIEESLLELLTDRIPLIDQPIFYTIIFYLIMSKSTIYSILGLIAVITISVSVFMVIQNSSDSSAEILNTDNDTSAFQQNDNSSDNSNTTNEVEGSIGLSRSNDTDPNVSDVEVFNKTTLKAFDGRDGNKCYVAVEGKVYDVSDVPEFANGRHTPTGGQVKCGQDGTAAITTSPHGKRVLTNLKVVGNFE
jgi:predicted heme/steroid binding protein